MAGEYAPLRLADAITRRRFAGRSSGLVKSMRGQIEIKCIECCGWDRLEAKQCAITTCALWATNRRIFKQDKLSLTPATATEILDALSVPKAERERANRIVKEVTDGRARKDPSKTGPT